MTDTLRERVMGGIDERAEHERAGVAYLVDLVESRQDELRQAFLDPEVDTPESEIPELMYQSTSAALVHLNYLAKRAAGVYLAYFPVGTEVDDPLVKMGWTEFVPALPVREDYKPGKDFPHIPVVTDSGRELLDGWRKAKGLPSAEEARKASAEMWDRVFSREIDDSEEVEEETGQAS